MTGTALRLEIAQQPEVAAGMIERCWPMLDEWRSAMQLDDLDGLMLAARGSSDNAARYAQYLWSIRLGLPVMLATPSIGTVYGAQVDMSRWGVVAISQSGASPDIVSVVKRSRALGSRTMAITNDADSPLAQAAHVVLDLETGPEVSVAASKTYTASVLAVALVGVAFGERADRKQAEHDLQRVPEAMEAAVSLTTGVDEASKVLAGVDRSVVVGRGLNLSTAHETALKLTELTGVLVAPYSPADLLHGPVAAVGPDVPVVLVAPDEPASASVLDVIPELRRRSSPVVLIRQHTDDTDPSPATGVHDVVLPPRGRVEGWLTPLTAVVPGQLLALDVAQSRGIDVDRPGGLSKVTLTT